MKHWIEKRIVASIYCVVTVVLCLIYAETRTELPDWWKGHGGGIPYVMFWAAFLHFWTPSPNRILGLCVIATVGTCLLEILQPAYA